MDSIQIEKSMAKLFFVFFRILEKIEIDTTLRVSIWLEEDDSYLMPCEFTEVLREDNFYAIKTNVLDPKRVVSANHLEKKFLFGHPGKVIGYGILKEIVQNAARAGVGPLKNVSGNLDYAAKLARNQPYGPVNNIFRRLPKSTQDIAALEGAMQGKGRLIIRSLSDPRYKGWEKWHYSVGPKGSKSVVHYIRNPKTGYLTDFKFK